MKNKLQITTRLIVILNFFASIAYGQTTVCPPCNDLVNPRVINGTDLEIHGGRIKNWGDVNIVANSDNNPSGGDQSIYFRTNPNSIRMTIGASGVGIGTTSPQTGLHIGLGNLRLDGGEIQHWGAMTLRPDWDNNSSDAHVLFLKQGGSEAFRMHRDGYLLFTASALAKKISLYQTVENNHQFFGFGMNTTTDMKYQVIGTTGRHIFYTGITSSQSNELMRIQGNGNVGIGVTADASEKLQINEGLIQVTGTVIPNNTNPGLRIGNVGTTYSWLQASNAPLALNPSGTNYVAVGFQPGTAGITVPVGIGLAVKGKILCEELKVKYIGQWPDVVFSPSYNLPSLEEVERYYTENKHLKDVPSEAEVNANGIQSGEMDATLLKKIEELTIYMVELNKEVKALKEKNKQLETQLQHR